MSSRQRVGDVREGVRRRGPSISLEVGDMLMAGSPVHPWPAVPDSSFRASRAGRMAVGQSRQA
jgi:hypothetical protein